MKDVYLFSMGIDFELHGLASNTTDYCYFEDFNQEISTFWYASDQESGNPWTDSCLVPIIPNLLQTYCFPSGHML